MEEMKLIPPIYWDLNQSEVKKEIIRALKSKSIYFQAEPGNRLIPFIGINPGIHSDLILWNRKQLEIALKYQANRKDTA